MSLEKELDGPVDPSTVKIDKVYEKLLPPFDEELFNDFVQRLRSGEEIQNSIRVDQNGYIIEGHNRWKAWKEAFGDSKPFPAEKIKRRHVANREEGILLVLEYNFSGRRHCFTQDYEHLIRELHGMGWSNGMIADRLKCVPKTIWNACKKLGIQPAKGKTTGKDGKSRPPRLSSDDLRKRREQVVALKGEGLSHQEIADKLDIVRATVVNDLKAALAEPAADAEPSDEPMVPLDTASTGENARVDPFPEDEPEAVPDGVSAAPSASGQDDVESSNEEPSTPLEEPQAAEAAPGEATTDRSGEQANATQAPGEAADADVSAEEEAVLEANEEAAEQEQEPFALAFAPRQKSIQLPARLSQHPICAIISDEPEEAKEMFFEIAQKRDNALLLATIVPGQKIPSIQYNIMQKQHIFVPVDYWPLVRLDDGFPNHFKRHQFKLLLFRNSSINFENFTYQQAVQEPSRDGYIGRSISVMSPLQIFMEAENVEWYGKRKKRKAKKAKKFK